MSQFRTKSVKISTIMNSRDFKDGYASAVDGKPFDYTLGRDFCYERGRMFATWVKAEGMAHVEPYRNTMPIAKQVALLHLFVAAKRSGALI